MEMKECLIYILIPSWAESIQQAVPDNEERCRVYEYIIYECFRIGYGVQHKLTKPNGNAGILSDMILKQMELLAISSHDIAEALINKEE